MKLFLLVVTVLATVALRAQSNYALDLNGTNQYVSISTPLSNNTSYTKEAWVYVTTTAGARNIISSANAPFWINGGQLNAGHGGNYSQVVDPAVITINKWTHVAVTYDAATTTMRLYRDGILVNTNAGVASNYTSENTYIGSHAGAGSYLQGMIDEVRIWNVARTQAQLKQNLLDPPANNESGLAAYYKLDNGAGAVATNSTGGTDGTLQNSPAWLIGPVQFTGNALNLDGSSDIVTIADHSSLDITSAITMEAWVFATKNTGLQNVVSKSSSGANNGYIFPRTDNGWTDVVVYFWIGGSFRTVSAPYPSLNTWHHLAATYDGSTIRLYINGTEASSLAFAGSINANNNPLVIGNQTGFSEYFGGSVDEIRIWNVARTQAQISSNMNTVLDPAAQTGLVSYYTMDQGISSGTNTGLTTVVDMKSENNGTLSTFALTGATSNYVMQNATLPVQWISFNARALHDEVMLEWSTAVEQNTSEYIVQHSRNGTSWKDIGKVLAAGNSNEVSRYSYVHASPSNDLNYYRLLQIDRDGRSSYSEVRKINIAVNKTSFTVLKNPVDNEMIQVRVSKTTNLLLFSSDGKLLLQKQFSAGTFTISLSGFAKGIYFLKDASKIETVMLK